MRDELITVLSTPIDGAVVTTTSEAINIEGAKKITFLFVRTAHSAGNTVFTVTGSLDGTNYSALNKLITNVVNTNAQTVARVASVTLSLNVTELVSLDLKYDTFKEIKLTATRTTDGTATVYAFIEY